MVKPLDGHAFDTYCPRLGFKEETCKLIALIRASPIGCNPRGSKGNVWVWYPSKKMPSIIKAESRRDEFPRFLEPEYDDDALDRK